MNKIRTTITINKKLLKKAKKHKIKISTFLDRKLQEYLSYIGGGFDTSFCSKDVGYDVALTTWRSPVQFWPGPLKVDLKWLKKYYFHLKNA